MDKKTTRGRKPKFVITDAILKKVEKYAKEGLYDYQIAQKLKICHKTLERRKKDNSLFCLAIKKGRDSADVQVENRLFKDACTAGNTTAQIFYLKNRRPDRWKDKHEVQASIDVDFADRLTKAFKRDAELQEQRRKET